MSEDNKRKMIQMALSGQAAHNIVVGREHLSVLHYVLRIEMMKQFSKALETLDAKAKLSDNPSLFTIQNLTSFVPVVDSYQKLDYALSDADTALLKPGVIKTVLVLPLDVFNGILPLVTKGLTVEGFPPLGEADLKFFDEEFALLQPYVDEVKKLMDESAAEMLAIRDEARQLSESFGEKNPFMDEASPSEASPEPEDHDHPVATNIYTAKDDDGYLN